MSYARFEFPRIDVTIDVEGTKLDYSFHLEGYANASSNYCNVMVSVSSAVCREGDITLEGKRHHVVLLDYNSNGRFDDESKISENIHMASGQLYPEPGDMLLIDPKAGAAAFDSPYDPTSSDYRYYVSKMIPIDGRWYDLKISPAGDKLTLTPSTVPLGSVTNRNEAFRALIYGDGKGFLKIRGTKGAPIPVPEGQWKLLSYTITARRAGQTGRQSGRPKTAEKKPADKAAKAKQGSLLAALGTADRWRRQRSRSTRAFLRLRHGDGQIQGRHGPQGRDRRVALRPALYADRDGHVLRSSNGQAEQLYLEMSLVGVRRRSVYEHDGQGRPARQTRVHHHRPQGQSGPTGQFRVWLRFHLPVLVASTIRAGERVSRQREDEGRSLRDRPAQRQRDSSPESALIRP